MTDIGPDNQEQLVIRGAERIGVAESDQTAETV